MVHKLIRLMTWSKLVMFFSLLNDFLLTSSLTNPTLQVGTHTPGVQRLEMVFSYLVRLT